MDKLIDITAYPVKETLKLLLKDKTTGKNIIWATDAYMALGYTDRSQLTMDALIGNTAIDLRPRIQKSMEAQMDRTRKKGEVFTPAWLCNRMNNHADEVWFDCKDVFNIEDSGNGWETREAKIEFPKKKHWQKYVDSRRLEITCGEAPYLVSRYDASTGEPILPLKRRIGMLDRKLRIVNENTETEEDWTKWAVRALQSCYGYEWSGDSLLIARINVLMTFFEYFTNRWGKDPDKKLLKAVANIIAWNLWQMDGLKDTVPLGMPKEEEHQITIFEWMDPDAEKKETAPYCRIYDWRRGNSRLYKDLKG